MQFDHHPLTIDRRRNAAVKLGRKAQLPSGYACADFNTCRPARDQGDFQDVGIADMACVNQFGQANNAKHYHGGVFKVEMALVGVLGVGAHSSGQVMVGAFGGQD